MGYHDKETENSCCLLGSGIHIPEIFWAEVLLIFPHTGKMISLPRAALIN